jgi:hypothetical protein
MLAAVVTSERVKLLLGMEENTMVEYKFHADSVRVRIGCCRSRCQSADVDARDTPWCCAQDKSTYKNTESFVFVAPTPSPKFTSRLNPSIPALEPLPEAAEKVKPSPKLTPKLTPASPAFLPTSAVAGAAAKAEDMAALTLS